MAFTGLLWAFCSFHGTMLQTEKRLEKRQETRRMSDRKKEGGRSGMVLELNPEQKQRVNLSLHAQEILEADREQFAPQLTKNGFFNELLYRFAPQAGASISQTLERRRQTILLQLENLGMQKKRLDPETAEAVTKALLLPVRKELEMKAVSYPKGTSVLFRLSNRNSDLFYDPDWPDAAFYRNKPARYMKALIEEYASHTQYQREAFYFNEWISQADAAAAAWLPRRASPAGSPAPRAGRCRWSR